MTSCIPTVNSTLQGYYLLDPDDDLDEVGTEAPPRPLPPTTGKPRRGVSDRWHSPDPLAELIDVLKLTGRPHEAEIIERVLGLDDDEQAMRAYVFQQWAEDWDSPEDAIYDET
jgi:hypothetical protein